MQPSATSSTKHVLRDQSQIAATTLSTIDRIVVPFDYSDCTKKALAYAVALAKHFNAALRVLICQPADSPELSEYLKTLLAELAEKLPVTHRSAPGDLKQELIAETLRSHASFIVLGTGSAGFSCTIDGKGIEEIVREAPCPVIVIHAKENEFIEGKEMPASGERRR